MKDSSSDVYPLLSMCRFLAFVFSALCLAACSTTPFFYSPGRVARLVDAGQAWQAAQALAGIDTGPRGQPVALVVWFNPQCPECAHQFQALAPWLDKVRIHWVPVGSDRPGIGLGRCRRIPASLDLAANLLAQIHAAAALYRNEMQFDVAHCHGGYPWVRDPLPWALRTMRHNTRAMRAFKVYGTPTMFYMTPAGLMRQEGPTTGAELTRIMDALRPGSDERPG